MVKGVYLMGFKFGTKRYISRFSGIDENACYQGYNAMEILGNPVS